MVTFIPCQINNRLKSVILFRTLLSTVKRKDVKEAIRNSAPKAKDGSFIDPNTNKKIKKGQEVFGHKTGNEWKKYKKSTELQ